MNLSAKIEQPEGRRLEFKEVMPTNAELAKTIVSFANDAGGELYIGIKNNPREIAGLPQVYGCIRVKQFAITSTH